MVATRGVGRRSVCGWAGAGAVVAPNTQKARGAGSLHASGALPRGSGEGLFPLAILAAAAARGSLAKRDALPFTGRNEMPTRLDFAQDAVFLDHLGKAIE